MNELTDHNREILSATYISAVIDEINEEHPDALFFIIRSDCGSVVTLMCFDPEIKVSASSYHYLLIKLKRKTGRERLPYAPMMAKLLAEVLITAKSAN